MLGLVTSFAFNTLYYPSSLIIRTALFFITPAVVNIGLKLIYRIVRAVVTVFAAGISHSIQRYVSHYQREFCSLFHEKRRERNVGSVSCWRRYMNFYPC